MATIGALEAKTHFSALLERAQRGEQIVITKRGKPVARLVPMATTSAEKVSDAVAKLRELRKDTTMGSLSSKEMRDAGRTLGHAVVAKHMGHAQAIAAEGAITSRPLRRAQAPADSRKKL